MSDFLELAKLTGQLLAACAVILAAMYLLAFVLGYALGEPFA